MDPERRLHIVHLLIRNRVDGTVGFLVYPHDKWKDPEDRPYWVMPTKKTVLEPLAAFLQGSSLEHFIDGIMEEDLGLKKADDAYALEQELPPARGGNPFSEERPADGLHDLSRGRVGRSRPPGGRAGQGAGEMGGVPRRVGTDAALPDGGGRIPLH